MIMTVVVHVSAVYLVLIFRSVYDCGRYGAGIMTASLAEHNALRRERFFSWPILITCLYILSGLDGGMWA